VFNVLLNLWVIPAYSWRGAAWSSIASDAVLLLGVSTAVLVLSRRDRGRVAAFRVSSIALAPRLNPNATSTESIDAF
jgi:hypothetical protein